MKAIRSTGALVLGLASLAPAIAFAQSAPVAVPIVGSPASQQPSTPSRPPSTPSSSAVLPPARTTPIASSSAMPGPVPKRGIRTLELSLTNGTVALNAQNVTLREIFAEWQRQSGCRFVNAEKLPAAPVALQFPAGTPELAALDSILRGLASPTTGYGYIVAPRAAPPSGAAASRCGAVYILPTSRPTAVAGYVPPAAQAPARIGSPDDEIPPVVPFPGMTPVVRPAAGQTAPTPQPQPAQPYQLVPPPAGTPGQPAPPVNSPGSSTPAPSPSAGFGAVAPSAPGAGGLNTPPPQPQTQQQPPPQQQQNSNGR